ncbi:MAG TPA: ATP-binding cassette domain-containing protein [Conexibacter sp.]|nr:ATP-binding cassette domain-containing protein [Conexibacter sp.]
MSILALENVSKRYRRGHRELVALRDVALEVETGEVVCISGGRGSGRTTLLRIVAGAERPDEGHVRIAGVDLRDATDVLRRQIAFCNLRFLPAHGRDACEHVMMPLLALHVSQDEAGLLAHRALERVGVAELAFTAPSEWVPAEAVRVSLARALVREPRLLVLDEPANGVDLLERDPLLSLIREIAHDSGIATLFTAGETASVTGADRVLRLRDGELMGRTVPAAAKVVALRPPASEPSS